MREMNEGCGVYEMRKKEVNRERKHRIGRGATRRAWLRGRK